MTDQNNPIVFRKGKKITLRPVLHADIKKTIRWINDPDILQFLGRSLPGTEAQQEAWFKEISENTGADLTLAIVAEDTCIGSIGLHRIDHIHRTASFGFLIGEKKFQGKGLGTDAAMTMLDVAFNVLNIRKVIAAVYDHNPRSLASLRKCGFQEEGRRIKQYYKNGTYRDEIIVGLFREQWKDVWDDYEAKHQRPTISNRV